MLHFISFEKFFKKYLQLSPSSYSSKAMITSKFLKKKLLLEKQMAWEFFNNSEIITVCLCRVYIFIWNNTCVPIIPAHLHMRNDTSRNVRILWQKATSRMKLETIFHDEMQQFLKLSFLTIKVIPWTARVPLRSKNKSQ